MGDLGGGIPLIMQVLLHIKKQLILFVYCLITIVVSYINGTIWLENVISLSSKLVVSKQIIKAIKLSVNMIYLPSKTNKYHIEAVKQI